MGLIGRYARAQDGFRMSSSEFVTVKELSELLKVPESWIYDKTRQGQEAIPHYKLGKYVRFIPSEVMHFFKKKENLRYDTAL